jgi:hypothetical protein
MANVSDDDDRQFVVTMQVLVSVTDAERVTADPCAMRITQRDGGMVEVYVPDLDEAVLNRFSSLLDSWVQTVNGMQVREHTETVKPWEPGTGRTAWWDTDLA